MLPKIVLTDIDGVWTDGGMYYDQGENELKKFNTFDSAGVLLLRNAGIETAIITGEKNNIVKRRAEKLNIELLYMGVKDKVRVAEEISALRGIKLSEMAYIGDDLNDILLLQKVGLSATPAQSPDYVSRHVKWKLKLSGGEGVFREFALRILEENNLLQKAIDTFLNHVRPIEGK